jgi:ABC-type branched-subunit amino acid transport system ATPase component
LWARAAQVISDYGYMLSQRRIDLEGPALKLIDDEHVRAAYLGV